MTSIKQNLAYAYQIIAHLQMDDHTYTHLSARSKNPEHYYIYPFGLRFEEVTEECFLTLNLNGEIKKGKELQYNRTGFTIHGTIYGFRPDVQAIFHLHTPASVAVSAMKNGLMPISQWALHFYEQVAYHQYDSLVLENEQGNKLIQDLGPKNIMFLRNHGFLTCGRTIMEAMFYAYHLEMACKTQCLSLQSGQELILPDEKTCKKAVQDLLSFEKSLGERDWQAWIRLIKNKKSF